MAADLNPQQREAIRYIDGPALVLAGAGSGKTRVITQKIAWLIQGCDISPRNIAAVTFTNKAAREMKQRVQSLMQNTDTRGLRINTFHTLGLDILRKEAEAVGIKSGFSIFDDQDTQGLIRDILHRDVGGDMDIVGVMRNKISAWKNNLTSPEHAESYAETPEDAMAARVYAAYEKYLKAYNAVDFDDLIVRVVRLFQTRADRLEYWRNRIRFLLVDEYQDTNECQYQLVKMLVGTGQGLTVVGDDDQSIYAWRGARPENLAQLAQDFPRLKVIKLEQNYRSMGRILKAANVLIANNPHVFSKNLWSDKGHGDRLRVIQCRDELHEAERVVSDILAHRFQHRTSYGEYAILYRGNHQSRLFETALREQRIPYFISGGTSFFDRSEVRDILSYLKLLANTVDDTAYLRIINTPKREIGAATLEKLGNYAQQRGISLFDASGEFGLTQTLSEKAVNNLQMFREWILRLQERAMRGDFMSAVTDLVQESRYEQYLLDTCASEQQAERRMQNIHELLAWIKRIVEQDEKKENAQDIVSHLMLMNILDRQNEDENDDCVNLLTLHASKGLEFPHVFMVGVEEESLPHRSSIEEDNIEEERRLMYVGITRAQKTLTMTHVSKRRRFGETINCDPSRFIDELPAEDLIREGGRHEANPEESKQRGHAHLANLRDMLKS